MALTDYTNYLRAPAMQVYLLNAGVLNIDTLISTGTITLNTHVRTHLYDIVPSTDFAITDGFSFSLKRLKSIKLPKMGVPLEKDPFLGYDSEGMQQYDLVVNGDPDTSVSWTAKLDGSEQDLFYPKADAAQATTTHPGFTIKRAGLRVGEVPILKDVLVILDGTIGNTNGKKTVHFFKNVPLQFTPQEGAADNRKDLTGSFEGVAEKHYVETN